MRPLHHTIDLHTHSTASDGLLPPAELVRLANRRELSGIALTDHDTTAGLAEAAAEATALGLRFLPGIEISCNFPRPGTLHMLGYGIDPTCLHLRKLIAQLAEERTARLEGILKLLARDGMQLSMAELNDLAHGGSIGRPHIAELMVREGHVATRREAFDKYLGASGSAYVDTHQVTAEQAIRAIRRAGGIASLAHPLQLRRKDYPALCAMVRELAGQGMQGLETIHPSHATHDVHRLTRLADRLGLVTTGGSDFHGPPRGAPLGNPSHPIPEPWWADLHDRLSRSGGARRGRALSRRDGRG